MRLRTRIELDHVALDKQAAVTRSEFAASQAELSEILAAEATARELASAVAEQLALEEELKEAREEQRRLDETGSQLAKHQSHRTRLADQVKMLTEQLSAGDGLEVERAAVAGEIESERTALDGFGAETAQCKVEADAIKSQSEALAEVETALCPVCEQPLDENHRATLQARNDQRLETLRNRYRQLQSDTQSGQARLKQLSRELERIHKAQRELPRAQELATTQENLTTTESEIASAEARLHELMNAPQRVTDVEAKLAKLGNPRQAHALASDRAAQRGRVETRSSQLQAQSNKLTSEMAALQEQLLAFADLDGALQEVAGAVEQNADAYRIVLSNRQAAETVDLRRREVDGLQTDLVAAQQQTERLAAQLAEAQAAFDEENYEETVLAEQTARETRAGLQTRLAMMDREQERDRSEIAALELHTTELAAAQTLRKELEGQASLLETVRGVIREAGPYVTRTLIRQISDGAARIFGDIMQDYSRHLTWDETYNITLNVDGHERHFGQLSGGEQMSAALSVRLALLREMSTIDIAFFDEPTSNLDDVRRESLARQILNVRGFRQLFVISHDDTFEQATQNLIRVERVGGQSVVSFE
ncbi:MAG: SMC family ATPase [Caldilineaceae bacterium]|nr:SMC family ATPase [Caldilineaceae bacterium]